MPQPAPQRENVQPDAMVIIQNHVPNHPSVNIPNDGVVTITNSDPTDCLIQLWTEDNDDHPPLAIFIAAGDTVTFMDDPGSHDTTCYYNVLQTDKADEGDDSITGGGGNKIIIGSGGVE
jgi:hypothetical protein